MPIYKKKNGKWGIVNVKGDSSSKAAAEKRLAAIKINQAKRGK